MPGEDYEDMWASDEMASYRRRIIRDLVPKIEESALVCSLVPSSGTKTDVKFAVELGFSIMLDKPILAIVKPGTKVPNKLVLVADEIVECDMANPRDREKLAEAIARFHDRYGDRGDDT